MTIAYSAPFNRAWKRMTATLFRPFDLHRWMALGFTAFLAGLTDWTGGGSSRWNRPLEGRDWHDLLGLPADVWVWLTGHPVWAVLIMVGVLIVIALSVLLTWLSSRGKFMFLDNVVRGRSEVTAPWHEFRTLGDSLFIGRLLLGAAAFAVFSIYLLACLLVLIGMAGRGEAGGDILPAVLLMGLGLLVLILVSAFVDICLNDFVVPIMAKRKKTVIPAAGLFWDLFRKDPASFLLYGLMVFFMKIAVAVLVVAVGLFTCCIGFLLLAIPYVNAVILLPVSFVFRTFPLEFLGQFGADFDVFRSGGRAAAKPRAGRKTASGPKRPSASARKK
jgi:hypothetical protein